jgi:vancomycin resistance protein YoaR
LHGITKYLSLALLCVLICLVTWDFLFWSGRFPPNCYIEKLDVSGLSKIEAFNTLKNSKVDSIISGPILLVLEGQTLSYKPSELGIYLSPHKTINNASATSYRSNYIDDLTKRFLGSYKKQVVPLALSVDRGTLRVVVEGLAKSFDAPSKEATFRLLEGGEYRITREKVGREINIQASISNLEKALDNNERLAKIEVSALEPRVYSKSLVKFPPKHLLSEYTTYYGSHDSPNRVHNIKVASGRLNRYVLVSGETFSLLENLGEFSLKRGFKEAFVLYNGALEPQYGGGSCQIATTLFNSALLAGLDIIERHNHDIYFTIYPLGRDASIYSGTRDLKIRNNTSHPIMIETEATDKKLTFRLYGTPSARKISFARPVIYFDGERPVPYNVMSDEATAKIKKALISGDSFSTYVKVVQESGGYSEERVVRSHYRLTGDRENVKIVRPEPD